MSTKPSEPCWLGKPTRHIRSKREGSGLNIKLNENVNRKVLSLPFCAVCSMLYYVLLALTSIAKHPLSNRLGPVLVFDSSFVKLTLYHAKSPNCSYDLLSQRWIEKRWLVRPVSSFCEEDVHMSRSLENNRMLNFHFEVALCHLRPVCTELSIQCSLDVMVLVGTLCWRFNVMSSGISILMSRDAACTRSKDTENVLCRLQPVSVFYQE
jgi:hypothetical protein